MVSTADFFTPIVDDPYDFGRIAATGQAGDELWLTKPVGGGVATPALKRGKASARLLETTVEVMATLNRDAAAAARAAGASAMTDVTGFWPSRPPARAGSAG